MVYKKTLTDTSIIWPKATESTGECINQLIYKLFKEIKDKHLHSSPELDLFEKKKDK